MDLGQLITLLDKYGIPLVSIAVLSAAVIVLFKLYRDAITATNTAAIKVLVDAVASEKGLREKAEARLESNSTALREATVGFAAALALMEKLADRDARSPSRSR